MRPPQRATSGSSREPPRAAGRLREPGPAPERIPPPLPARTAPARTGDGRRCGCPSTAFPPRSLVGAVVPSRRASRPAAGRHCGARTTAPSMRRAGAVPACGAGRLCDGGRFVIEGEGCGSRNGARLRWRPEERCRGSCLAICGGSRVGAVVVRVLRGRGRAWGVLCEGGVGEGRRAPGPTPRLG